MLVGWNQEDKKNIVESFRIKQVTPEKCNETYIEPLGWIQVMQLLQERHDLVCVKGLTVNKTNETQK